MKKMLVVFAVLLIICFGAVNYVLFPLRYKSEIMKYSQQYGVNASVVAGVINAESGFNNNAVSVKGAVGLMQILPSTAKWVYSQIHTDSFNEEMLKNPQVNIQLGCYYLNYLQNKFDNLTCVLCAYNAGETVVRQWLNNSQYSQDNLTLIDIPYKETKQYVKKVQNYIKVYNNKI